MADEKNPNDPYGSYGQSGYGQEGASSPYGSEYGQEQQPAYGEQAPSYGEGQGGYGQQAGYDQTQQYGADQYGQTQQYGADQYGQTQQYGAEQYGQAAPQYGADQYGAAAYGAGQYGQTQQVPEKFNVWGMIAVIAGGLGIISAICVLFAGPALALLSGFLGFVAVVMGILGLVLKGYNVKKGLAITGLILGVLTGILSMVMPAIWGINAVNQIANDYSSTYGTSTYGSGSGTSSTSGSGSSSTGETAQVEIIITSTSTKPADIDLFMDNGVYSGSDSWSVDETKTSQTLPWSQTYEVPIGEGSPATYFSISATGTNSTDEYTCEIKVNGVSEVKETSVFAWCMYTGDLK